MSGASEGFAQWRIGEFGGRTARHGKRGGYCSTRDHAHRPVDGNGRAVAPPWMGGDDSRRPPVKVQAHDEIKAKIWEIANRLSGPYRPPQYRLVKLPMVVLRRLDCVLAPTKDAVLKTLESFAGLRRAVSTSSRSPSESPGSQSSLRIFCHTGSRSIERRRWDVAVGNGKVSFLLDNGRMLSLSHGDPQLRHLDHTWASTVHAFQVQNVDRELGL